MKFTSALTELKFNVRYVLLLISMISTVSQADISFNGFTRLFYDGERKQMPILLVNEDAEPALVQVKISWGDSHELRDLPMTLSRPLLVIPEHSKASIDILYEGRGLPTDRESFFLLKVLQVPKKSIAENSMQVALQHNLKLFYRPTLPGSAIDAVKNLHWSISKSSNYRADNKSPYYITLTSVQLIDEEGAVCGASVDHLMIAPFSSYEFTTKDCDKIASYVKGSVISDGGKAYDYKGYL